MIERTLCIRFFDGLVLMNLFHLRIFLNRLSAIYENRIKISGSL